MNAASLNHYEALFWLVMAIIVLIASMRADGNRLKRLAFITAGWLALFALSDVIEMSTGAWWRPLWLLLLKAACVIALTTCGYRFLKHHRPKR